MSQPSISLSLQRARERATKDGWDASLVRSEVDARAVVDEGCYYDEAAARRVLNFFTNILHHEDTSAGTTGPFKLLPWQEHELIRPLFGWKRRDGTRRYRRAGIWVPKKNGKSTLAAGLELYMLIADKEPSAGVYSAANDRQQAGIIHGHAVRMVELSPILAKRIGKRGIIRSTKTIYDAESGSTFKALSADAPTKEGLNIHALIVDELHGLKNRAYWDTLVYGGASRRQPLMVSISTAGVYDIMTIAWEQYTYARDIANGNNDTDWSFFPLIYEAGTEDDWREAETHRKANPSYGVTVRIDTLEEECREAQVEPRKESAFRRYRLNQWPQQMTRWIPLEQWDANHSHPVTRQALAGALTFGGMDLGAVSDITAAVLLCACPHDPEAVDVLLRCWLPDAVMQDQHNRNIDLYRQWVEQGLLTVTPGQSTNYKWIEQATIEDAKYFNFKVIALDALFQGQQVANNLADEGIDVVAIGQGPRSQGPPMKEFERMWLACKIHHGGHPILRWMADNVEVKADEYGNLKIVKPNSRNDPRKVDGIQALVNAIDARSRHSEREPEFHMSFVGGVR